MNVWNQNRKDAFAKLASVSPCDGYHINILISETLNNMLRIYAQASDHFGRILKRNEANAHFFNNSKKNGGFADSFFHSAM